ncbi:MAG: hypothetical protein Q8Q60_00795 [Candidatus Chromulinivorax sp.]|nr:hypothetical protein [Candidatus Chromulinivorax sp.]
MIKIRLFFTIFIIFHAQFYASEKQPTTIYCHGLGGSQYEFHGLMQAKVIHEPANGVQFKNERDSCLGHGKNIETLNDKINPTNEHIFYGISCGGVGIVSWLAKHNSHSAKAVILDATPSDMVNLVEEAQYKIGLWALWTRAHKEWALHRLFPEYPQQSMPPVQAIAKIKNKNIAVFIVHSQNDPVVDIRAALENYKAFLQADFKNAYICLLEHGGHMNNAFGQDSLIFKQALNSFYKKYSLKYHEEYAILTDEELQQFQPSIEEIDEMLLQNLSKLRKQGLFNLGIYAAIEHLLATQPQNESCNVLNAPYKAASTHSVTTEHYQIVQDFIKKKHPEYKKSYVSPQKTSSLRNAILNTKFSFEK